MRNNIIIRAVLIILMSVSVSGCLSLLFTDAAFSTLKFAKDRSAGQTLTDNVLQLRLHLH